MTVKNLIKELKKYPHKSKVIVYVDHNLYEVRGVESSEPLPEYEIEENTIEIYCDLAPIELKD